MNRIFASFIMAVALQLCGCETPKFYDCEGVLTHDGRPVPYVQITFAPDIIDSVRMPLGVTDAEGRFEMFCGRHLGVPPGSYTVYVEDPGAADGRQTSTDPDYLYVIDRYSEGKSDFKYVADQHRLEFELKLDTKEFAPPEAPETEEAVASSD